MKKPILSVEFNTTEIFRSRSSTLSSSSSSSDTTSSSPRHVLVYPVTDNLRIDETAEIVACLLIGFAWGSFLNVMLHDSIPPLSVVVVVDRCTNTASTYKVQGSTVTFIGQGGMHDDEYGHFLEDSFFRTNFTSRTLRKNQTS